MGTDKLPYVTMGSGSLAAMSIFEAGYREDLDEASAKLLVQNAIRLESSTTSVLAAMSICALFEERMSKCSATWRSPTNSRHCVPLSLAPKLVTSAVVPHLFFPQLSLLMKIKMLQLRPKLNILHKFKINKFVM